MSPSSHPGAFGPVRERRGRFAALAATLPASCLVIADRRVLALHPDAKRALRGRNSIALAAGERAKSLATLQRIAAAALRLGRDTTVLALGGGTIGDLATVFAHVHKRGVRLVHCPTTALAAIDSSVGGKGALNVAGIKNALGVFHSPAETWLCSEFFATLRPAQIEEGRIEAWKVALADPGIWRAWCARPPDDARLLREARALKTAIVASDPYETLPGRRSVLNFGHTFGHVFEALTGFRLRHGLAVRLGIRCALDVGVELGVTPSAIAAHVESSFPGLGEARSRLSAALAGHARERVRTLLATDKKGADGRSVTMILLRRPGRLVEMRVAHAVWQRLYARWSNARAQ